MHYSSICFIDWNGHINYKRHASSWKRRGNLCLDSKGKHIDLELSWHDKIPVVCQTCVYQRFFLLYVKMYWTWKNYRLHSAFSNAIIRKCWIIKTKSYEISAFNLLIILKLSQSQNRITWHLVCNELVINICQGQYQKSLK